MSPIWNLDLSWMATIVFIVLLYCIPVVTYRLYLSPLAKFPGPKLAAATLWYEAYYDVVKKGQYTFRIKELHKKYGPIIRISPNELHVDDPEFYEQLYSHNSPRNKYHYYTIQQGIPKSTFGTVDHRLHRLRRQPQNSFFSKQSILRLEPVIFSMIEKLCLRIDQYKKSGQAMPIRLGYQCLATDIITLYAMNKNAQFLDSPDFSPRWFQTIKATATSGHLIKQFPWLLSVSSALPDWALSRLSPDIFLVLQWQKNLGRDIQAIIDDGERKGELPRTIFQALLDSDLPSEEKSLDRLWQEAQLIIGAGSDTVANAMTVTTFHILNNSEVFTKLRRELETAIPDHSAPTKLSIVEKLPYLSAVIQEGLRLAYGLSTRLQRIAPHEDLRFREWSIPAGTPVGMTSVLMHHNETIFPNSYDFIPERWLGDNASTLEKYMVSFSRGSRQCLGMTLARAEMSLTLATVFRRYDLELFDTIRERDVDLAYDGFLPQPSPESKGVWVTIK